MFTLIKRFFFFFLTNIAILLLFSVIMFGVNLFFPWLITRYGWMMNILIYAWIFWFLWSFVSLFLSRWSAKRMYDITLLEANSEKDAKLQIVWDTVERISQAQGIRMPEVWYYHSPDPNAFATWATKNSSLVAVSTGLLELMDKNEIEWVVAHEMAHILNGDMVTLSLIQWVMNTFVIVLSELLTRVIVSFFSKDGENSSIGTLAYTGIYMACQVVFGFLAMFVVMWFSRMREYRADLGWAQYSSKTKMIAWLKKLQTLTAKNQFPIEGKMAAFMIAEPDSFFSTHPSLVNRIKALEENYQL